MSLVTEKDLIKQAYRNLSGAILMAIVITTVLLGASTMVVVSVMNPARFIDIIAAIGISTSAIMLSEVVLFSGLLGIAGETYNPDAQRELCSKT